MTVPTSAEHYAEATIVSPYLERPLRTYEEALADIRKKRKPTNVCAFFPKVTSRDSTCPTRSNAA